jgi:hypothetical protein
MSDFCGIILVVGVCLSAFMLGVIADELKLIRKAIKKEEE